jgi:hypothetical protein
VLPRHMFCEQLDARVDLGRQAQGGTLGFIGIINGDGIPKVKRNRFNHDRLPVRDWGDVSTPIIAQERMGPKVRDSIFECDKMGDVNSAHAVQGCAEP